MNSDYGMDCVEGKNYDPPILGKRLLHVLRATRRLPETFNSA